MLTEVDWWLVLTIAGGVSMGKSLYVISMGIADLILKRVKP